MTPTDRDDGFGRGVKASVIADRRSGDRHRVIGSSDYRAIGLSKQSSNLQSGDRGIEERTEEK
jgi:hypothetical protein